MTRWRLLAAFTLAAALFHSTTASPARADDIVIGEYGSMTGSQATFGVSTDNGVKLAVQEINDKGGINGQKIRLINYDDKGSQQEAQTAVTRLIDQAHAVAIIGEVASSLSMAGGAIAQRKGVPMVSPSSTNPKVTAIGDMISRVCFIDPFQGYVCAGFAKDQLKVETAAILYNRAQAYSSGLRTDFAKSFGKAQIVSDQAFTDGDNDFSAQLTAIRQTNPGVIFIPAYYNDVVTIARQARQLGITCPLLGGDGWVSDELKNAGHALDGCYFSDHYAKEDTRPEVQAFLAKYKAAYNQNPDSMAALGYDAAALLADAIGRAKSTDGKAIAAAINSTKDFKGVTGAITMDENRNAKKSAVIQKLNNGEFSYFATVLPPK